MPLKIARGQMLPIGVDLGSSMVRMAQLRAAGDVVELVAAGSAEVPRPVAGQDDERLSALRDAIRGILKFNEFKSRQAILSLPASRVFVQHVRMPKMAAAETAKALGFELQGKLPFAAEDAVIRHVVAGDVFAEGEAKQEVIVVAASRDVLDSYLAMASQAGLDVVGINIDACAVVECFGRLFRRAADTGRAILFVDIGAMTTQVALSHGHQVVFARNLMVGGDQLDKAVADGLKTTVEQARILRRDGQKAAKDSAAEDELYHLMDAALGTISDEVNTCLHYYESVFRNQGVERAIFVGGQAYDKRLCQALAQRLNLPAQVGDPLVRIKRIEGAGLAIGLDRREPQPDWAVAVGLSIGAAEAA